MNYSEVIVFLMQNIGSSVLCAIRKKIQTQMSMASLHIRWCFIAFYCFKLSSTYFIFPLSFLWYVLPTYLHSLTHLVCIHPLNFIAFHFEYCYAHTQPDKYDFLFKYIWFQSLLLCMEKPIIVSLFHRLG